MFSRVVKHLRAYSLTWKLVLLYTCSTLGILTALGLFFYSKTLGMALHLSPDQMVYWRAQCYDMMIIAFLIGALGAMGLGYVVTRRGLSGITTFAETLSDITAESLHQRLDPSKWPTELRYLGEICNHMLDRLQTSFDQLSQFSADIAHELRTPVHNLMMMTEWALSKERTKQAYQQTLSNQMPAFQDLASLIDNLLFLARSDYGQQRLVYEQFPAHTDIQSLFTTYQGLISEKHLRMQCRGEIEMYADRGLFKRMMTNLIANALCYTPPGGEIWVEMVAEAKQYRIVVGDTGVGIPAHHIQRLCDRCYRVDTDRNPESGGLGLGLAIVKSILDLHGGTLHIISQEQVGTSVQVYFPRVSRG